MSSSFRQLIVGAGVAALVAAGLAMSFDRDRPLTDADRSRALAEMEAEYGITPRPDDDLDRRFARIQEKVDQKHLRQRLDIYRRELDARGYIGDPTPDEEKFLREHQAELPNLVVRKSQSVDVELIGWPLKEYMTVESCELEARLLRCLARIRPGYPLEGWRLAAKASRWDGARFVDLAGTSVTAPHLMGGGSSEIEIRLPSRADLVFLSYR